MKSSLIKKTVILIVCIGLLVGTLAIAIYNKGMYDVIISQYERYSIDITKLMSVEIDAERLSNVQKAIVDIYRNSENKVMSDKWGTPEFDAYVSQFDSVKETDDYKAILSHLKKMQGELDVDCLYIFWVDPANECYLYLIDAADEDPCPPGCIDPLFVDNPEEYLADINIASPPNITNTPEYGWLISTGMPIHNSAGEVVAMSGVDISMNHAMAQLKQFMFYIASAFLAVIAIVCIVSIFLINRFIVRPINTLSRAASKYKDDKNAFSHLKIKRSDEIGLLSDSMIKMESDINGYVDDLIYAREHADRMDRAANIDALTKVGNKRAYDIAVKRLNAGEGHYGIVLIDMNDLKEINDNYGHEKGDLSIKTVSRIICGVFNPASVYRVGGDEFIVILENADYKNRVKLLNKISETFESNKSNDTLPPWERVTAAVGCATHNLKKDKNVASVMQRADSAMYENKKAMKETD